MRILYQIPSLDTIYAGRTIYYGYKNAFEDLGHKFLPLTSSSDSSKIFEEFRPDIFMTSLHPYYLKYLDLSVIKEQRKSGMRVFVNIPFWKSPFSKTRINEANGLSDNKRYKDLISSGNYGDVYYNSCEKSDRRMKEFENGTGKKHICIPLAVDKIALKEEFNKKYETDISFVGTYLPQKRNYFKNYVFPLKNKYNVKLYGQDWNIFDRACGWVQRLGQYFNISFLSRIRLPKLQLIDEARIYKSSVISLNVHEDYQKEFGGDCNERTFKIPACGGFEITDDVACIRRYFKDGEEIVIAKNKDDWFEKINYYMENQEKRLSIVNAGRKKALKEHTYHNRIEQIISIHKEIKG